MWNKSRLVKILSAFLIPVLLLLLIYWQVGLYPFGNHTVGYGDLANQYVALMSYFKENFTNYHNFLYSFSFSLGENFFPVFAYYLSSPINLVALLFPVKDMLLFFELNVVFNAGVSGLTMYLYLTNSLKKGYQTIRPNSDIIHMHLDSLHNPVPIILTHKASFKKIIVHFHSDLRGQYSWFKESFHKLGMHGKIMTQIGFTL